MSNRPLSKDLGDWALNNQDKTIGSLDKSFGNKSFAVGLIILLAPSALPIPTGGITTILELIALIIALQLLVGRTTLWIPKRWQNIKISSSVSKKGIPRLVKFIAWFEKITKFRQERLFKSKLFVSFTAVILILFILGALLSPPFSGLDTLPSIGVVILAMSIISEDIGLFIIGSAVGLAGNILLWTIGLTALKYFSGIL